MSMMHQPTTAHLQAQVQDWNKLHLIVLPSLNSSSRRVSLQCSNKAVEGYTVVLRSSASTFWLASHLPFVLGSAHLLKQSLFLMRSACMAYVGSQRARLKPLSSTIFLRMNKRQNL